jgi:hypothetical protein
MCDCLEGEESDGAPELTVPLAALMERTQALEARKPGDRVPEALWPIFFGQRSGSIAWPHHQRMLACRTTALALLTASASARRRGCLAGLRCAVEA